MKSALIISVFMIVTFHVSGQKKAIEAKVSSVFVGKTLRVIASPQFVMEFKQHRWGVGPTFLVITESLVSDKKLPKLSGLQLNYAFDPLLSTRKINFFLFNSLSLQRVTDKWTSTAWRAATEIYESSGYSSTEYIAIDHLGYGMNIQLCKNLSINQSIGLGFYYSTTDNKAMTKGAPEISNKNINGYSSAGFSWGINIGFKYSL